MTTTVPPRGKRLRPPYRKGQVLFGFDGYAAAHDPRHRTWVPEPLTWGRGGNREDDTIREVDQGRQHPRPVLVPEYAGKDHQRPGRRQIGECADERGHGGPVVRDIEHEEAFADPVNLTPAGPPHPGDALADGVERRGTADQFKRPYRQSGVGGLMRPGQRGLQFHGSPQAGMQHEARASPSETQIGHVPPGLDEVDRGAHRAGPVAQHAHNGGPSLRRSPGAPRA